MKDFISSYNEVAEGIYSNALSKGWWDDPRNNGEAIALMHSELSEALEALRINNPLDPHCPGFLSVEVELADVIIRIMDFATGRNFRVAEALVAKAAFNQSRPRKHGKEF